MRGGGRQDFLRHVLLRVLAAVLRSAQPQLLTTLLKDADPVSRLVDALAPEAGRPASSPEHARLLAIELLDSAALFPFLGELLAESGGAKGLRELTGPPLVRRSMSARSVMALQIAPVVAAPVAAEVNGAAAPAAAVAADPTAEYTPYFSKDTGYTIWLNKKNPRNSYYEYPDKKKK